MSAFDPKDVSEIYVPNQQEPKQQTSSFAAEDVYQGDLQDPTSKLESGARGYVQGATLGFADEITGAAMALYDMAEQKVQGGASIDDFSTLYKQYRDLNRKADEKSARDNPKTAAALDLVGGLFTGGALANRAGKMAVSNMGKVGAQVAEATGEGALTGAGRSQELNSRDIKKGAFLGGASAGLGHGLGTLMGKSGKAIQDLPASTKERVIKYTEEAANLQPSNKKAILNNMKKFITDEKEREDKYAKTFLYLHDSGIVKAGDTAQDISAKLQELNKKKGLQLDSLVSNADSQRKVNISANTVINQAMTDTMNAGYLKSSKMSPHVFQYTEELQKAGKEVKDAGRLLDADSLRRSEIQLNKTKGGNELQKTLETHPELQYMQKEIKDTQKVLKEVGEARTSINKQLRKATDEHPELQRIKKELVETKRLLLNREPDTNNKYLTSHIDDLNNQYKKILQSDPDIQSINKRLDELGEINTQASERLDDFHTQIKEFPKVDPEMQRMAKRNQDIAKDFQMTNKTPTEMQVNKKTGKVIKNEMQALRDDASPMQKAEVTFLFDKLLPDLQGRFGKDTSLGNLRRMKMHLDDAVKAAKVPTHPLAGNINILRSVRNSVSGQIKRELGKVDKTLQKNWVDINSDISLGMTLMDQVKLAAEKAGNKSVFDMPLTLKTIGSATLYGITKPWKIPGIILGNNLKEKYGKAILADSFGRLNEMVTRGSLKSFPQFGGLLNNAYIKGGIPELTRQHIKLLSTEPMYRKNYKEIYDKYEGEIREEHKQR